MSGEDTVAYTNVDIDNINNNDEIEDECVAYTDTDTDNINNNHDTDANNINNNDNTDADNNNTNDDIVLGDNIDLLTDLRIGTSFPDKKTAEKSLRSKLTFG